jgi:hypothetical protein
MLIRIRNRHISVLSMQVRIYYLESQINANQNMNLGYAILKLEF